MLFEITKRIGEIEFDKMQLDKDISLIDHIRNNPSLISNIPNKLSEIVPFNFALNSEGFMQFREIMLPITNIEEYGNKLLYIKGRENGGDYTPTSRFYIKGVKSSKNPSKSENSEEPEINSNEPINPIKYIWESPFKRTVTTKIFDTASSNCLKEIHNKLAKENNSEYMNIIKPFILFCQFFKYYHSVEKEGQNIKTFFPIIKEIETYLVANGYNSTLGKENYKEMVAVKNAKLVNFFSEKNINIQGLFNLYVEKFNLTGLLKEYQQKYIDAAETMNKDERDKKRLTTVTFSQGEDVLFLSDIKCMGELIVANLIDSYSDNGKNVGTGVCAICGEHHTVYGNAIGDLKAPYNQFSGNKAIYCSNGADHNRMWANFPVCIDCILKLVKGKNIVQSIPFRNEYKGRNDDKGIRYYILPYTTSMKAFETFYKSFKNSQIQLSQSENYLQTLKQLAVQGKIQILNKVYDDAILAKEDIGLYFIFTDEPQEATYIYRTINNSSLNKVQNFNNKLNEVSKMEYFKYHPTTKGLEESFEPKQSLQYMFLEECKNLFRYDLKIDNDKDKKKINRKDFLEFVDNILSNETVNIQIIVDKMVEWLLFLYRNTKSDDIEKVYYKFNDLIFVYCVLNKMNGGNVNLKAQYEVTYSGENRNFTDKMVECIDDIAIDSEIEKALFVLGFLVKKIVTKQKDNNLSGNFSDVLMHKINSTKDIVQIYNKTSNMIINKYKKELGYLNPILELSSQYISAINSGKINKEFCTFRLIQGYNLERRFVKKEDTRIKEENN